MPNTVGPADMPNLLVATQELAGRVNDLSAHLTVSQDQALRAEKQAQRTRYLTRLVLVLAILSLVGVFITGTLILKVQDATDANKANAVTGCQNANESRQANKALWDFLITASLAQSTQTPQSRQLLEEIQVFISELFQQHDCSELGKKYPLPDPPPITDLGQPAK